MNKSVISVIILLFSLLGMGVNAQDNKITINGMIADATTGEPIPFANLGVLGTLAGVASDMDGKFELVLPDNYVDRIIRVSVVGYASYEIKVAEAGQKGFLRIVLKPVTYGIGEAEVYAESLVYKKMLRQVVENISRNYISRPYNYEGYFQYTITENGNPQSMKEAIVTIFDNKGYERSDVHTAYKDLNYRFDQVRRDREVQSVLDGLTYFDDILTSDVIRNTRNILDIANAADYKLKNKGRLMYEGDSVRLIAYEVEKPSLSTSGDAAVTKYSGEIYINLKDYAVLKNVIHISADNFNQLGRNLIPANGTKKEDVKMTIVTNYKKLNSVYFLSGITIQYTYKEGENDINGRMQYVTTRVQTDSPEAIQGRMYYEDIKTDKNFWDNYTVYFKE